MMKSLPVSDCHEVNFGFSCCLSSLTENKLHMFSQVENALRQKLVFIQFNTKSTTFTKGEYFNIFINVTVKVNIFIILS